jgi:hypothetical protein
MEKVVTVACGPVDSICDGKGNWLSRDSARLLYEEVWDILEMAMERSREDSVTISDKATMMEFFRQEVGRRRAERERPGEYETLMMQIVEMWGAFMGNECGHQSLKNTWLDAGLEGGMFLFSFNELRHTTDFEQTTCSWHRLSRTFCLASFSRRWVWLRMPYDLVVRSHESQIIAEQRLLISKQPMDSELPLTT